MGMREQLGERLVYFDTNIFIYALEAVPAYRRQLATLAEALDEGGCVAVTSELTLSEILTKPFRDGTLDVVAAYREVLEAGSIQLTPVTRAILLRSAMLRGQLGLKTADAIHVATAINAGCAAFLTNDAAIRLPKCIVPILFSDG